MSDGFVEKDITIEALVAELKTLKSTSQQLEAAEKASSQIMQSAQKVTDLSAQVMKNSTKQVDAVAKLAKDTETQLNELIAEQKAFADRTEDYLRDELQPRIAKLQASVRGLRWLLLLLILLALANAALVAWLSRSQFYP